MLDVEVRAELLEAARMLERTGLNAGTSGNVSVRQNGGFLITPSGIAPAEMTVDMLVSMGMSGAWTGTRRPSTEWPLHRAVYAARPDAHAIVHTHSMFATTLSCQHRNIPAFHYMVAVAGGHDIPCAAYATFGTGALAEAAVEALAGRKACLLAQHGMLAIGTTLKDVCALALEVERLAEMYWRTLQTGEPRLLDAAEMARVLARFADYRRPQD
ncbi:MAG: class II aldolase/adducin family protein [Chromatiales bacterium]|nr:class II aldolase/adducin family protein [Chromatiales bacterium]